MTDVHDNSKIINAFIERIEFLESIKRCVNRHNPYGENNTYPQKDDDETDVEYVKRLLKYMKFLEHSITNGFIWFIRLDSLEEIEQKFLNTTYVKSDSEYEQMIKETMCGDKNDINV